MGNNITKAAKVDFGIQWTCWALASFLRSEKYYDLAGSSTILVLAWLSLIQGRHFHTRQKVATGLVTAWAVRLGSFLFSRVLKTGRDRRFNGVRDNPGLFWIYWTIQGVWVISTLLPVLMLNGKKKDKPLTTQDYIGWALWGIGFYLEVVADYQKSVFNSNPENTGKFIQHGLWSLCRHPNYLGEILMWTGLYITSSTVLSGFEHISIISPTLLSFLLIKVSGIPMLENYGLKKWGNSTEYQAYLQKTAKLLPYIW